MADIFLSYNREDQPTAKLIANALAGEGFEVWWDTVLRAGQTYDEVTERQLHDASAVVVLWSSRSVRSKWVRAEATLGDRKSALIPVMIEQCDRPIMFELIQTADLTKWTGDLEDRQWKAFVEDVREHVERKRGAAAAAAAPTPVATAAEAKAASSDAKDTIEAAFWLSIKDDNDASEFAAYLERYPDGHFAMLARKRLAVLTPKAVPPPPATSQPVAPKPAPPPVIEPVAAKPAPLQSAPKADAFQQRAVQAKAPPPKKDGSPLPLILGLVAILAVGGGAFAIMSKPAEPSPAAQIKDALQDTIAKTVDSAIETATATTVTPPTPPAAPVIEKTFKECEGCPEMTRLDGGNFVMGSADSESGHRAWEGPQREVTIAPLAVSAHEITFAEWDACVAAGGCMNYTPADKGWGRGARPAIMVSWNDAQTYVKWLSGKTGKTYRLPTEAEWEYAARGGTTTAYWWGAKYESGRVTGGKTAEVGAHDANPFGLFDVSGNVSEWVQDCYVNSFKAAPTDGSAVQQSGCGQRVTRGGSWKVSGADMRIANRSRLSPSTRDTAIGFRVVVTE